MFLRVILLLTIISSHTDGELSEDDEHLLYLTSDNFDQAIIDNQILLVNFEAPWCGHCKTFMPEYFKSAVYAKQEELEVRLAVVDVSKEPLLAARHKIQGYPTIRLFINGKHDLDYVGVRKSEDLLNFLKLRTKPHVEILSTIDELLEVLKQSVSSTYVNRETGAVIALGVFPRINNQMRSAGYKRYLETVEAITTDLVRFAITEAERLVEHFNARGDTLIMLNGFVGESGFQVLGQVSPRGQETVDEMEDLLQSYSHPALLVLSESTRPILATLSHKPHVLLFLDDVTAGNEMAQVTAKMTNLANLYRKSAVFVSIPLSSAAFAWNIFNVSYEEVAVAPSVVPRAVLLVEERESGDMRRFVMSPAVNYSDPVCGESDDRALQEVELGLWTSDSEFEAQLASFLEQYLDGALRPTLMSEEEQDMSSSSSGSSSDSDRFGVKRVVGKSFQRKVMDTENDVLLAFIAPWCGFCKALMPVLDDLVVALAAALATSVTVGVIDRTKNEVDHSQVEVAAFPTIYLFPKENKSHPIMYEGDNTLDGISKFLVESLSGTSRASRIKQFAAPLSQQ